MLLYGQCETREFEVDASNTARNFVLSFRLGAMGDPSDCTPEKEQVTGSAPQDVKDRITQAFYGYIAVRCGFGDFILKRTRITEISRCSKAEEPSRKEGRIVCELEVASGKLGSSGHALRSYWSTSELFVQTWLIQEETCTEVGWSRMTYEVGCCLITKHLQLAILGCAAFLVDV